jgi:hypothetical protein
MIGKRGVAVALLSGFVLFGCGPKKNPTMEPSVQQQDGSDAPKPQTADDRNEQVGAAIDSFAGARKEIRGHSDEQSRRELADAFGKLQDVLKALKGPDADGAFRQQIRIIDRARTQLTGDSATAPEPTINAAIRAAQNALATMASERYADDEQVKTALAALQPRIDSLNTVRGPIHGFETAKALDEIGLVAQRMADVLQQRATPATAPAAPKATA